MIYNRILLITLIIIVIYILIITLTINKEATEEQKEATEATEERQNYYLQLQNMTTDEILLFKNKKEFINSIEGYNTIQYFLKGTEEQNIEQLIDWYYPGYKKL